jgi:hypothetical protein
MTAGDREDYPTSGVSESIGFMLIFMMVIAGIGLVTLYGYPMLLTQQVNADEKIMEKNMIVLQNDLKSITYKTVPYKETSLKIGGGSLSVYNATFNPTVATVRIYDSSRTYMEAFRSGDLRYASESSGTDISLQNGAVVTRRHAEPGSAMLAEPRWFYDGQTNTMVINLISLNSTDVMSRTGVGTVQMALGDTSYQFTEGILDEIRLDYTPDSTSVSAQDYRTAWDNYFTHTLNMVRVSAPDASTITYRLPTDTGSPANLVIKTYDVVIRSL